MNNAIWRKAGRSLIPSSSEAEDWLVSLPDGQDIIGALRRLGPRNVRQFRLFHVLAHILVEHQLYPTDEKARDAIKIAAGHFRMVALPNPVEIQLVPNSIAWSNLEEDDFIKFFNAAIEVICTRFLPGTNDEELRQRVYELTDGPQRTSLGKRA